MKRNSILLLMVYLFFAGTMSAQSIWWENGKEYIRKDGDIYKPATESVFSYLITDNKCWRLLRGDKEKDIPLCHFKKENDRVNYFKEDALVGYYVPSQYRYYIVSYGAESAKKEGSIAVLMDGKLYDGNGEVRYTVDESITPEIMGVFLFMNL